MRSSLVIGAAGFVGGYLTERLMALGDEVFATKLPSEEIHKPCNIRNLDILDSDAVFRLIGEVKPDRIFHLAAQSSVAVSWEKPALTAQINVVGTINVLEAVRKAAPQAVVLLIGSSEEYGRVSSPNSVISENQPLNPANIYAVTKAAQNNIGEIYHSAYCMNIISTRAFNHFGPGQLPQFVVSDFCRQTAEIEKGMRKPEISVGNLSARRDFTDVRDIVRAYAMLAEKGKYGQTYNVGSGKAVEIRSILELILSLSSARITVRNDPSRMRPSDVPEIRADISRIVSDIGWKPQIDIRDTVSDTLDYWRRRCDLENN